MGLQDPDTAFNNFFNSVNALVDQHVPIKMLSKRKIKKTSKLWITKGIRVSIKVRDKLLASYIKEKNEALRSNLRSNLQQKHRFYQNQIVKLTRISKTSHFNEYFATNIKNSKNIWKGVKELIQGPKKYSNNTITLKISNEIHSDPKRVAEEFNKHFSSIADKIRAKIPESDTDFRTSLKNSPAYSFFTDHIHTNEVTKIINSLGPKSTGPCSIPNTILKTVVIDISEILAKIFNLSIQTGIFPSALKTAKVVPVFKNKGSTKDVNNYRPIYLLSNIDKIFKKLIHSRVVKFLDQNNCLFNHEYGFRKKHSTTHALANLAELICANMDKGIYSCGIFINLQKAFDTVDHEILLTKFEHYGISHYMSLQ